MLSILVNKIQRLGNVELVPTESFTKLLFDFIVDYDQ